MLGGGVLSPPGTTTVVGSRPLRDARECSCASPTSYKRRLGVGKSVSSNTASWSCNFGHLTFPRRSARKIRPSYILAHNVHRQTDENLRKFVFFGRLRATTAAPTTDHRCQPYQMPEDSSRLARNSKDTPQSNNKAIGAHGGAGNQLKRAISGAYKCTYLAYVGLQLASKALMNLAAEGQ